jgi:hypothetical protein
MAMAFPYGDRARGYSYSWRIAAAGLMGLSFLAGYALLLFAADLPTQIGSVYRHELPGTAISLLGGGLLPIMLLLMVMDLETRRRQRRRRSRSRRRGEPAPYGGGESMMPPMEMQPPRYRHRAPSPPRAMPAAPISPPPVSADAPRPLPSPPPVPPGTPPAASADNPTP